MSNRYTAAINAHQAAITELARQQAELAKFGEDDYADDSVVAFDHQFNSYGPRYKYTAYKIKGHWYISGGSGARYTWDQLVEFMKDSSYFYYVKSWEKVF